MKPILVQKKSTSILQDLFYVVVSESNNSIQLHKPPHEKALDNSTLIIYHGRGEETEDEEDRGSEGETGEILVQCEASC